MSDDETSERHKDGTSFTETSNRQNIEKSSNKSSFTEKSVPKSSFIKKSLVKTSNCDNNEKSFAESSSVKTSFTEKSFTEKSFTEKSFTETSFVDSEETSCEKCGQRVSPFELPEHLDFHLAQDLEKQLRQEHLPVRTGKKDRQTDRQDERYRDKDR